MKFALEWALWQYIEGAKMCQFKTSVTKNWCCHHYYLDGQTIKWKCHQRLLSLWSVLCHSATCCTIPLTDTKASYTCLYFIVLDESTVPSSPYILEANYDIIDFSALHSFVTEIFVYNQQKYLTHWFMMTLYRIIINCSAKHVYHLVFHRIPISRLPYPRS